MRAGQEVVDEEGAGALEVEGATEEVVVTEGMGEATEDMEEVEMIVVVEEMPTVDMAEAGIEMEVGETDVIEAIQGVAAAPDPGVTQEDGRRGVLQGGREAVRGRQADPEAGPRQCVECGNWK